MGILARLRGCEDSRVVLGKGISGKVELHQKGKSSYVVKTYLCKEEHESRKEYRKRVLYEYHLLASIDHPNFIKVVKSDVSLDGLSVKMYMEAGAQDLGALLKHSHDRLTRIEVFSIWKQICEGIRYLHLIGLCHRDLKLENLVMDRSFSKVKIIDLVTATDCRQPAVGIVGSARYMAPEMASKISYDGLKVDIWSIGIIVFYLISREFPWKQASHVDPRFVAYNQRQMLGKDGVSNGESFPLPARDKNDDSFREYPPSAVLLLSQMLLVDPDRRVSIDSICADEWFQKLNVCALKSLPKGYEDSIQ